MYKLISNTKFYVINSLGNIINLKTGKKLNPYISRSGYFRIRLQVGLKAHKNYTIHRIIASLFIDNPLNKPQVNHIDGNRLNNNIDNLEWVTGSENMLHSTRILSKRIGSQIEWSKLSELDVQNICMDSLKEYSLKKLANKYNVSKSNISSILNGKTWISITKNYNHIPISKSTQCLNEEIVRNICNELLLDSQVNIAKKYNITVACVNDISKQRSWAHITKEFDHIPFRKYKHKP